MKKLIIIIFMIITYFNMYSQDAVKDTVSLKTVVITANRLPLKLMSNPGSVALVTRGELSKMPKTVCADEAMRLVPGVRVDNQHNGEFIHMSIRGQGILTERGLRGIGVMLDGIPLNDPSGFAPDLYDVDWATVRRIEVLRGPLAGVYGSSAAAGMLNIETMNGGSKPVGGTVIGSVGSYGFHKTLMQLDGSVKPLDYRINYSNSGSAGYRDHQAFTSNKLYEKVNLHPSDNFTLTQVIMHTGYFHQNPEGLDFARLDNPKQANPDANPFNEYRNTVRTTFGLSGKYDIKNTAHLKFYSFYRLGDYKETSNKAAEYRDISAPGAGLQYDYNFGNAKWHHRVGAGADLKWQNIKMYKLQSAPFPQRVESIDKTNIETDSLLANQIIEQNGAGIYGFYNLKNGKFNFLAGIRFDDIRNSLTDKMLWVDSNKTSMDFSRMSYRVGLSYAIALNTTLFAGYGSGFMPPSTEELAANPLGYSGFNTHLVPAVAQSFEAGVRGFCFNNVFFDITGFYMKTKDDFFRFKQSGRGNQEVFYGNAGNSRRIGLEAFISLHFTKNLALQTAYTFSDFVYVSSDIDPVYLDTDYVLTTPPAPGQYLPNSPKHQLFAELNYNFKKRIVLGISTQVQSQWVIYTDAKVYSGDADHDIYRNICDGFALLNARIAYFWKTNGLSGELNLSARNITGTDYMAFTEPDPDGNSYHPAPKQEIFAGVVVRF